MKPFFFLLTIAFFISFQVTIAQTTSPLSELKGHSVKILYSKDHEPRARSIAERVNKAMSYFEDLLSFKPQVTLLVLNEADWKIHTTVPMIYGMPHYTNEKVLIVAAEDNDFWRSFLPLTAQLPNHLKEPIQKTYTNKNGTISMQPFFDLLALHELGHAFHMQAGLNMQRKWMGELFSNMLLHTYVAEKEKETLSALTLFPQMVINGGTQNYKYTSLQDLEANYSEIGMQHPNNYGWYQSRWHAAAARIYDEGGVTVVQKLWKALQKEKETFEDAALITLLESEVHKSMADFIRNWDAETRK